MKKIIALVISVLLSAALLASCAKSGSTTSAGYGSNSAVAPAAPANQAAGSGKTTAVPGKPPASTGTLTAADKEGALTSGSLTASLNGDKIIYNYGAQIETTKFNDALKNLEMLLNRYGAFVESSYISGNNYGNTTYRSADYTVRVPVQNFKSMTGSLTTIGNVYDEKTTSQNITAQFIDTQSRLNAFKTEETRLLSMLEKATTVQDMIAIESRLSDIRYQIESLTTTLQNWQNQVDFSTVTLRIREVSELKEQKPVQRSYWEKMSDGIVSTLNGIGDFFKEFFLVIVVLLPVLLILGAITVLIIVLVRASRKKKRAKLMNQMNQGQMNQGQMNPYYQQNPNNPPNRNTPPNQSGDKKE